MNPSTADALSALSPLDGRYRRELEPLRAYFSEFALIRGRLEIEIDYLLALPQTGLVRVPDGSEVARLQALVSEFSVDDAARVKEHEQVTRHDVKALEYYLREKLIEWSLSDLVEWLHFGLTSEDVTQTAQALALRDSRDRVLLPAFDNLLDRLTALARENKKTVMLGRTHGQPAVPTTLGKELAVFVARLKKARAELAGHRFEAKLTGAVGNLNALAAAAPGVDWLAFGDAFIRQHDLEPNRVTTQILPFDNWIVYFDALRRANGILIGLAQDLWRYVADEALVLSTDPRQVGSSTMPQKVNPIDLENAEGNLGLANALLTHYGQKLSASRLQRDLSDSTVRRSFGEALGHTLLAWNSLASGLPLLGADEAKLRGELEAHWEVVAEGAQTILRAARYPDAYEAVRQLTRGQRLTRDQFLAWIDGLDVPEQVKGSLRGLSPVNYLGLSEQIADEVVGT